MKTSIPVTIAALVVFISLSQARQYRVSGTGVDLVRVKRQSHPDLTEASLPDQPFQGPPAITDLSASNVPLEYLTPPAVDAPVGDLSETIQDGEATPPPLPSPPDIISEEIQQSQLKQKDSLSQIPQAPSQILQFSPQVPQQTSPIQPQIPEQFSPIQPQIPQQFSPIQPQIPQQISQIQPQIPQQITEIQPQVPQQISQFPPQISPIIPQKISQLPSQVTQQATPNANDKWELGYNAGDLLIPPTLEDNNSAQYNTIKIKQTDPIPDSITEQPSTLISQFEQVKSGSVQSKRNADFAVGLTPPRRPRRSRQVYSYVKTNPQGHYKWGVRIGH